MSNEAQERSEPILTAKDLMEDFSAVMVINRSSLQALYTIRQLAEALEHSLGCEIEMNMALPPCEECKAHRDLLRRFREGS